jgi:type I restriction enzyme R subunit
MARADYTEDAMVQQPAISQLINMGWQYTHAFDTEFKNGVSTLGRRTQHDVILVNDLRPALKRINPDVPDSVIEEAIARIQQRGLNVDLIKENERRYDEFLREPIRGLSGTNAQGKTQDYSVRVIDFNCIENNTFHIVDELWVANPINERKRPDLLAFINGLPLVFFEFKNTHVSKDYAYKGNLSDYKDKIPHLFDYNALVIISNMLEASYGSITAPLDQFKQWKRNDENDPEPPVGENQQPRLLAGLMQPKTLLDMIENFILFERPVTGGIHKIVARNHQYLGVNRVIDRLNSTDPTVQAEVKAGRLGVFWHTQGSGKSYSMVFLTEKIQRKMGGAYSFILVTDRTELDDQISETYVNCGKASTDSDRIVSGKQLKQKLVSGNQSYLFTMVHKYNQVVKEPYSERDNIIVISDEAHRSQYGDLANNMRAALPNAKFLGFTGTPLMDSPEDQKTQEWFGDYVSIYNFQRAVADKATVPLVYENHGALLKLNADDQLNQSIADRIERARQNGKSEETIEKLVRAAQSDYQILTAPKRLAEVAADIVQHYPSRWKAVDGSNSKAMLVCLDRPTCLKMYQLITEKWQVLIAEKEAKLAQEQDGMPINDPYLVEQAEHLAWLKATEFAVVISGEQNEIADLKQQVDHRGQPLDIQPHREKMQLRKLDQEFKDAKNPLRFVIVCAMWLTGFDVKSLATLYLDKPMQGHTLMQAIARANRVTGGKKNGLIVDYNGMLDSLRKALSVFAVGQTSPTQKAVDPLLDPEIPFQEYQAALTDMLTYGQQQGADIAALVAAPAEQRAQVLYDCQNALSGSKQTRAEFMARYRDLEQRYNNLLPSTDVIPSKPYLDALRAVYRQFASKEPTDSIFAELQSIQNLVNKHLSVEAKPAAEALKEYDLTQIDFVRLQQEFAKTQYKQSVMLALQDRIEQALQRLLAQNDKRYAFMEQYEKILERLNKNRSDVEIQKIFEELVRVHSALSEEEMRYVREGLNSDYELALFDKLDQPKLSKADRDALKQFAVELLAQIKDTVAKLQDWKEQESGKAAVKNLILGQIYTSELLSAQAFPFDQRQPYVDEIFQYVLSHQFIEQSATMS